MDLTSILFALGAVATSIYYFLVRKLHYWEKKGVIGPKPEIFFGNLKENIFRRTTRNELFEFFYNQFPKEKIVGLFQFWHPAVLVRDLNIVQHVFIRDFDNFVNRGVSVSEQGVGSNIAFVEGDKWRVLRSRLSPIFSTGKLKNMFHLIEEQGDKFMEYLVPLVQKSPVQDVHKLIQKFTIGSIAACAFGIDIDINVEDKKLTELHQMITYNYVANDLQFAFPGFFKNFSLEIFPNAITDYFSNLVRAIVTERKGVPSSRRDFMDLLLELKNAGEIHGAKKHENDKERSVRITDTLMAAQAFVFYVGGYETTASTLSFMMHELAYHQDIQDNLVQHINEVLQQNGGKLSFDCLKQMTYLDQTISETLRMYPLGDPLTRKSLSSYKIPGTDVTIDKDTMVFTSARGIHYDEQYYPEPHKFDPERFTPENIKARHPCAYMPFGLGPRNCIGIRFANVQAALGAVLMLTRYRVEPATDVREPFHYDPNLVVFGVTNGVPVRFVPRE